MKANFFFHNTIRKYIVSFENIFNNIKVRRGNNDITTVPIRWIMKEKMSEVRHDINKEPNVKTILPIISYDLTNIAYDEERATNLLHRKVHTNSTTGKINSILNQIPFSFDFKLIIHTRYEIEMLQIIEQILPFFRPSFNITIKALPEMGILQTDIPVIFTGITLDNDYANNIEDIRHLETVLTFKMRAWLYTDINDDAPIINRVLIDFGVIGEDANQSYEGIEHITNPLVSTQEDEYSAEKNIFTNDDFENP